MTVGGWENLPDKDRRGQVRKVVILDKLTDR